MGSHGAGLLRRSLSLSFAELEAHLDLCSHAHIATPGAQTVRQATYKSSQ